MKDPRPFLNGDDDHNRRNEVIFQALNNLSPAQSGDVTFGSLASGSQSKVVTFPTPPLRNAPTVRLTVTGNPGAVLAVATPQNVTVGGFTLQVVSGAATTSPLTVHWEAFGG